jgi:branched-chain amino acid transport system substrate-binding protein
MIGLRHPNAGSPRGVGSPPIVASRRPHLLPALAALVLSSLILVACAPSAPPPKPIQPAPAPAMPAPSVQAPAPAPETVKAGAQVGLLLPLSGPQAGLGRAMLQAAEMGLFDVAGDDFELLVRDSAAAGGPDGAVVSVLGEKADIILGPLFGAELKMAAPPATAGKVPMVSFSNDTSTAQPGIYVLGVSPEAQVDRVVGYAASQQLKRFAIMVPNSGFGRAVLAAYQEAVVRHGGTIAQITFYDPQNPDITAPAREMGEAYQRTPFDALMIPEGGQRLRAFASMLPAFDLPPGVVRLLGTSLWQDSATLTEVALAGGWFPATPPDRWQAFAQRYASLYGGQPDPRAGVVYDAVTLAVALAQSKEGGDFSSTRITDPSGFAGVTGVFRLLADGRTERGLAVLEVAPGGFTVRDPAPTSFAATIN